MCNTIYPLKFAIESRSFLTLLTITAVLTKWHCGMCRGFAAIIKRTHQMGISMNWTGSPVALQLTKESAVPKDLLCDWVHPSVRIDVSSMLNAQKKLAQFHRELPSLAIGN